MLFRILKKWTKCVSNLFKMFKIKVWQSLRRGVFYHDFSGCCHTCKQGPVYCRSRVLFVRDLQFYTPPGKRKEIIK